MPTLPTIEQDVLIRFKADPGKLKRGAKQAQVALNKTALASKRAAVEMNSAAVAGEQIGRIGSALPGQMGTAAGAIGALTGAFRQSKTSMLAFGIGLAGVIAGAVRFGPMVVEWADNLLRVDNALGAISGSLDQVISKQREAVSLAASRTAGFLPGETVVSSSGRAIESERTESIRLANLKLGERQLQIAKSVTSTELAKLELARAIRETQADIVAINDRAASQASFVLEREIETHRQRRQAMERAEDERRKRGSAQRAEIANAKELLRLSEQYGTAFFGGNERILPGDVGGTTFLSPGGPGGGSARRGVGANVGRGNLGQGAADAFLRREELDALTQSMTNFGTATERVAEFAFAMRDGFLDAFDAIGSGQKSVTDALIDFAREGVAGALRAEAEKEFALGVADAIKLNPQAALHFAAAASLATAAGAIGGGSGAGAGSRGGGSLPGAAAGAFGGGGGQTREVVYIGLDSFDDDVRGKRRRLRGMQDRAEAELGPGDQIRRE